MDGKPSAEYNATGSLPAGKYKNNNTRWEFCCRNDAVYIDLRLPNTKPFILFPNNIYEKCPDVEGEMTYLFICTVLSASFSIR